VLLGATVYLLGSAAAGSVTTEQHHDPSADGSSR
jgi:hypothetical protein